MPRYYLKTPSLKKILQFQTRICFFLLKTQKNNHSLASDLWENTKCIFKVNARTFSNIQLLNKVLGFQD